MTSSNEQRVIPQRRFPVVAFAGPWIPWLVLVCSFVLNTELQGQTSDSPAPAKSLVSESLASNEAASPDDKELKAALEKFRAAVKETSLMRSKYFFGKKDEADDWQDKYKKSFKAGQQTKRDFFMIAFPILMAKPELNKEMTDLAAVMMLGAFDDNQFEMAFQLADRLEKIASSPESRVMKLRSAYMTNRFSVAMEMIPQVGETPQIPEDESKIFKAISRLIELEKAEEKIRAAELLADDLPRVELDTTEGKIVLELFENQYPNTVAHFISLVEQDFYKDMAFHKVIRNFLPFTMAQCGRVVFDKDPQSGQMGWRPKLIDYRIASEEPVDGIRRPHFRGTVCILTMNDPTGKPTPDTGEAEFFIEMAPLMLLESAYVPFGRVISDLTVIDRLRENFTISPKDFKESPILDAELSFLKSARVIRKRDHAYEPRKIK